MSNKNLRVCDFTDGIDVSTGFTPVTPQPPKPEIDLDLIMGVTSKMIGLELVEVEPMSGPKAKIHYFDF